MQFFSDLLVQLIGFIAGNLPSDFFDNQYISTSLDYFQSLGWIIFAIASLFMVFSVAEKKSAGEFVNPTTVFGNWVRALMMVVFSRPLVVYFFVLCRNIANALVVNILEQAKKVTVPQSILGTNFLGNLFTIIIDGAKFLAALESSGIVFFIMLIISIIMTIQLLRIFAILYVQIVGGYLSVVDLMLGDGGVFYGWMRDVIAVNVTFMLQYMMFIGGVVIINSESFNGLAACASGLVLVVGSTAVPAALKRYGFNYGGPSVGGAFAGLSRGAMSVGMIAARM